MPANGASYEMAARRKENDKTGGWTDVAAGLPVDTTDFLLGGGEMASLIRAKDWSRTALGPIGNWPQSLRTAASLCLASNFPINLIWGPEHTQIYNDGYRVVCGAAHPAALGQGYDVTWASAWPAIGRPFEKALKGEASFLENQRMFLTRNGYLEETFFTFSLSPIRDESGGIGGLFHPVTETTRTILSERRIRAMRDLGAALGGAANFEELAKQTVNSLASYEFSVPFVLFYLLDSDSGTYVLAAHRGAGPSPAEIAALAAEPWPFAAAVRETGMLEIRGVRERLRGAACGPYPEGPDQAFVAPIRAPGFDKPPAVVIFGVSPRLPLDDDYRALYELLAGSISAAFANARARDDERRRAEALTAIDRAKTLFFSNVSHEFRTPLTLMLGPIEDILAEASLAAAHRERLGMVHRNALRLLKLVNALLDFSRIEAGRAQAHFVPTDLAAFTADLASNFRAACERAGLQFVVDCPPLSRPVHVDREMWEKIVLNLLSNAFKFTLAGSVEVSLREGPAGTELIVRDSGVGVPSAELARLFERFHRIEGQRGRSHEGSGIGLSLVQELVGLHGGTIAAESVEGHGTTFRVTIPFGASHLPVDQIGEATATPAAAVRSNAFVDEALGWLRGASGDAAAAAPAAENRPRIVLADDNADMRNYVRGLLESGGYEVDAVADGAAALIAARKNPMPDLLLCDVMMPKLDGFALLGAVRADPRLEGLLVVMLSARAGEEARVEGLAAGADDYLVKPFSARELRARIDGAIRLGKQRNEAAARDRAANIELERRVAERTADLESARKALAISEAEFRASFEGAVVGKAMVEHGSNRLLRVNRAFADMLGREPHELVGRLGWELTWREDRIEDDAIYSRDLIAENDAVFREKRYMRRDGTPFWARVSASVVRVAGAADHPLVVVATIEDIDARRRAEDELRVAKRGLEQALGERTAALHQRDILLREVYHRVKNNLQIVDGLLMMQAMKLRNPAGRQALLALRGRVHALGLVHHQLMGSKDLKTFDIAPFLRDLSRNLVEASARDGVTIHVDASPLAVGLDFAIPIGMVVTELVTNSLKHAFADGEGNVSVVLKPDADGVVVLTVSDDGRGQGDGAARPSVSGLGSAIVSGLVNQIDGTITVRYLNGTTTEVRTKMRVH